MVLNAAGDISVVGECADGSEVLQAYEDCAPDVVLMDMRMPVVSGLVATRELLKRRPSSRVLMLTGTLTSTSLSAAADAGAYGYVLKGDAPELLVGAVRSVAAGGTAWPPGSPGNPPRIGG